MADKAVLVGDTVYVTLLAIPGHVRKVIKATVVEGDSNAEAVLFPTSTFVVKTLEAVQERNITEGQEIRDIPRDRITPIEVVRVKQQ